MAERERVRTGDSRGETVRRVVREQEAVMRAEGATPLRDPSSRRHLGTRGLLGSYAAGAVAGTLSAVLVLVADGGVGLAIAFGIAIAIVSGVISGLLLAEREDGRVGKGIGTHGRG